MPTVLITRPAAMSEVLANTLKKLGYETACEPMLSIEPVYAPQPGGKIDAVAITSSNALLALKERQSSITELLEIPCFCVGHRTAENARKIGFRNVRNADGDGTELAQLINQSTGKEVSSVLHIAGRDVIGTLREELERNGRSVIEWPVYEAIPARAITPATCERLINKKFDAVVVFSPKTARVLAELLAEAGLEACCAALSAICLSEAVADGLRPLKWRCLLASPQPTEDALIACLQETCPVTP